MLKVFRALRLLRVMKLARGWKELQSLLRKIKSAIMDILSFAILLFLFIFIFALLGMEFFANRVRLEELTGLIVPYNELQERYSKDPHSLIPLRENFDSIDRALTTVFAIAMKDDWQWRMIYHVAPFDRKYSLPIIFGFICCITIVSLTLLSLFTAILLEKFDASNDEDEELFKKKTKSGLSVKSRSNRQIVESEVQGERKKFFTMANWYAFKFEFLKTFDLRQPNKKKLNKISASPSSGIENE